MTAMLALLGPAQAEPIARHRTARWLGVLAGAGLYLTAETVAKDSIVPGHCRWCWAGSVDGGLHDALAWDDRRRASALSNVSGYVGVPVSVAVLSWLSSQRGDVLTDDLLAVAEAAVYSQLAVELIKITSGRQRPYAHYGGPVYVTTNDDNMSFVSGHSALAFSIATAAGVMAHARHAKYEAAIWATGMTFAAATAYLRIAAEQHYLSDVIAGGAVGAGAGLLLPHLLGALPLDAHVVPTGSGVAITGAF